jgi:hypothetical protein
MMKTSQETFDELQRIEALTKELKADTALDYEDFAERERQLRVERIEAIRNLIPREGLPCTMIYYSDSRASTVTRVVSDKAVYVRHNRTVCRDYYGSDYDILPELEGGEHKFTKRKNGEWVLEGHPVRDGVKLALHYQHHHIDPSF